MIANTQTKPRAFLLERTKYDTSRASRFGTLTYLFGQDAAMPSIFTPSWGRVVVSELMRKEFDPESDYIVVAGSFAPTTIMVANVVAQFGKVRLLCHEARQDTYKEVEIGGNDAR